ncbi:MAG: hypothetical protein WCK32_07315 [Chlorobiaceae bacterium]
MSLFLKYTPIIAPFLFFVGGVYIVMLLSKFIGKRTPDKKPE